MKRLPAGTAVKEVREEVEEGGRSGQCYFLWLPHVVPSWSCSCHASAVISALTAGEYCRHF